MPSSSDHSKRVETERQLRLHYEQTSRHLRDNKWELPLSDLEKFPAICEEVLDGPEGDGQTLWNSWQQWWASLNVPASMLPEFRSFEDRASPTMKFLSQYIKYQQLQSEGAQGTAEHINMMTALLDGCEHRFWEEWIKAPREKNENILPVVAYAIATRGEFGDFTACISGTKKFPNEFHPDLKRLYKGVSRAASRPDLGKVARRTVSALDTLKRKEDPHSLSIKALLDVSAIESPDLQCGEGATVDYSHVSEGGLGRPLSSVHTAGVLSLGRRSSSTVLSGAPDPATRVSKVVTDYTPFAQAKFDDMPREQAKRFIKHFFPQIEIIVMFAASPSRREAFKEAFFKDTIKEGGLRKLLDIGEQSSVDDEPMFWAKFVDFLCQIDSSSRVSSPFYRFLADWMKAESGEDDLLKNAKSRAAHIVEMSPTIDRQHQGFVACRANFISKSVDRVPLSGFGFSLDVEKNIKKVIEAKCAAITSGSAPSTARRASEPLLPSCAEEQKDGEGLLESATSLLVKGNDAMFAVGTSSTQSLSEGVAQEPPLSADTGCTPGT